MKQAVVLLSVAGSWLPATEQGLRELMCLFSFSAAGLFAIVKWTLEARGQSKSEGETGERACIFFF